MTPITPRSPPNAGKLPRSFAGNRSLLTPSENIPPLSRGKTSSAKGKPFQFEHASSNRSQNSRRNRRGRGLCPYHYQETARGLWMRNLLRHISKPPRSWFHDRFKRSYSNREY